MADETFEVTISEVDTFSVVVADETFEVNIIGEAGPKGDTGPSQENSAETDVDLIVGQAIAIENNGHLILAKADNILTANICGLSKDNFFATLSATYLYGGTISLSDWTIITGTLHLVIGSNYYLSPDVAGMLTTTAPSTEGQYVIKVGKALTANILEIDIEPSILL